MDLAQKRSFSLSVKLHINGHTMFCVRLFFTLEAVCPRSPHTSSKQHVSVGLVTKHNHDNTLTFSDNFINFEKFPLTLPGGI